MVVDLVTGKMTPEQSKEIIQALSEKGVKSPCPRCGNAHFTLLEGFFNQPISPDLNPMGAIAFSSGPTVPSVVTACSRCGFLSQHALGVLEPFLFLSGIMTGYPLRIEYSVACHSQRLNAIRRQRILHNQKARLLERFAFRMGKPMLQTR